MAGQGFDHKDRWDLPGPDRSGYSGRTDTYWGGYSVNRAQTFTFLRMNYTVFTMRVTFASLVLILFSFTAMAQVTIHVSPQRQKKYETVLARVGNTGSKPVTLCVEVGQTSPKGTGDIEITPSPFWVQRNNDGRWSTLMIGPDVGSLRKSEVLDQGKWLEFPFRLGDSGQMRLRLNYWNGSLPSLDCHVPPKNAKLVTSAIFVIE